MPEPVAAATYFAHTMIGRFGPGSHVVVYDLGAGTCDITMLRREPHGFDIVAYDGLNDVGGLDVDAAIVAFLEATYGPLWTDTVTRRQVWEDVRNAKEMLSRTSSTIITLPALGKEAPLGREQFDGLTTPVLRPTIALVTSLIRETAETAMPDAPTAVILVGGASRTPLVATLLAAATGIAPIVIEQPELVVAEGALHLTPPETTGAAPDAVAVGPGAAPDGASTSGASADDTPADPAGPVAATGSDPGAADSRATPDSAAARDNLAPGGDRAPGDEPASGGPAPAGSGRPRVLVAAVVAVVLLACVTGIVLLNRNDAGDGRAAIGRLTPSTGGGRSTGVPSNTHPPGKYAMAALPAKLCPLLALGKLGNTYNSYANTPTDSRAVTASTGTMTCSVILSNGANDTLDILVTAVVYTRTTEAVADQTAALTSARGADPNLTTLTGFGDEGFAARLGMATPTPGKFSYTAEVRDGNLRLSVLGIVYKANRQLPADEHIRQFGTDLTNVATSIFTK